MNRCLYCGVEGHWCQDEHVHALRVQLIQLYAHAHELSRAAIEHLDVATWKVMPLVDAAHLPTPTEHFASLHSDGEAALAVLKEWLDEVSP